MAGKLKRIAALPLGALAPLALAAALAAFSGGHAGSARAQEAESGAMRQMMREMMQGQVPPPGMTPQTLPAPQSAGARLLADYCMQCHDLPSPRYKTAEEWPAVFARMAWRMRTMAQGGMMGMHRLRAPSPAEEQTLLSYLTEHGMVAARPGELSLGSAEERGLFQSSCSRCHALPSPAMHPPGAWPSIVARMQANMWLMGKPQLSPPQQEAVLRFLQAASQAAAN